MLGDRPFIAENFHGMFWKYFAIHVISVYNILRVLLFQVAFIWNVWNFYVFPKGSAQNFSVEIIKIYNALFF